MELFRQLVRLSFEHPQYATPNFAELRLDNAKFDQYEWFASFLNTTYEELIINGLHKRPDYRAMMIDGFKTHAGYYLSPEWTKNNYDAHFDSGFVKLKNIALEEWKKEGKSPK